jgi:electron-transferring-flavoprotein dehydrogenase
VCQSLESSWVWDELKAVRNFQPSFHFGLLPGMAYSGLSGYLLKGREPWTFHNSSTDSEKVRRGVRACSWLVLAGIERIVLFA